MCVGTLFSVWGVTELSGVPKPPDGTATGLAPTYTPSASKSSSPVVCTCSPRRAQFFKLADIFLASGLVPAYTAAAFAKRFAHLALAAPPGGAMLAVAFIHNLIRRHPSCMVLLHRIPSLPAAGSGSAGAAGGADVGAGPRGGDAEADGLPNGAAKRSKLAQQQAAQQLGSSSAAAPALGVDPFIEGEHDPGASRAVESSLWELSALRQHYCPQVRAAAAAVLFYYAGSAGQQ